MQGVKSKNFSTGWTAWILLGSRRAEVVSDQLFFLFFGVLRWRHELQPADVLDDADGDGHESHNEDDQTDQGNQESSSGQGGKLHQRPGMTESDEKENQGEDQISQHGPGIETDSDQCAEGHIGDDSMTPRPEKSVHDMASVQLSYGK